MKHHHSIFFIIAMMAIALYFPISPLFGQTAPAATFSLSTPDGNSISLDQFKGQIVVLDFWSIHCPPCRMEIPGFIDIANKYKDKGVVVIGLSLDKDAAKLKKFVEEQKINYPIAMATKEVQSAYGNVQAIPTTFILDRSHNIVNKHVGFTQQSVFEAEIEKLLQSQPLSDSSSQKQSEPSTATSSSNPSSSTSKAD